MIRAIWFLPLLLAGCGSAAELKPLPGSHLPVAPRGAKETPSPDDLLTASTQQRPLRNDELLKSADARTPDDFDLPPN
jgi:hypothetical protein